MECQVAAETKHPVSTTLPNPAPNLGIDITQRTMPSVPRFVNAQAGLAASIRVAMPAVIYSFDAIKQTCVARPALQDITRLSGNEITFDLPDLLDVPVQCVRGGGFSVTVPLQQGDEGFVIFQDMCIDAWWQSGLPSSVAQGLMDRYRRHDLSDAVFVPGIWSQPNVLSDYSTESLQIRSDNGTVIIDVSDDGVQITAPTVSVQCTGTAVVSAEKVQVSATSMATVNANQITLESDTTIAMTAPSGLTLNGDSYGLHTHFSNPSNVGSTTGNIVPST